MKAVLRIAQLLAFLGLLISVVLLLNVTAPNPTGRRYSSKTPLTTGDGTSSAIGRSGEDVLSKDLRLPNNNGGNASCICGSGSTKVCKTCLTSVPSISTYRVPDFVGVGFLAESKNESGFIYDGREVGQINDYVIAALLMKVKLWVYVRVNTNVSPEFAQLVSSTGGGVVPYFTVPGYVDPVDSAAKTSAALSTGVLGVTLGVQWITRRMKNRLTVVTLPSPSGTPTMPKSPKRPSDPVTKAVRKTNAAEDFVTRAKDRHQRDIDIEDSRDDLL